MLVEFSKGLFEECPPFAPCHHGVGGGARSPHAHTALNASKFVFEHLVASIAMFATIRHAFHMQRACKGLGRRRIMTESIEPPLSSPVPERPCEVVLAQDSSFYTTSWQETFSQILPQERGFHFCNISIDCKSLQDGLDILQQDLAALPNPVLIARGPLVSLVAQYYLESLPLAGIVMVDPILSSHVEALQQLEPCSKQQHKFVQELLSGSELRPLKLEPGAVPVLVIQSMKNDVLREAAKDVALRHYDADGAFGESPVIDIADQDALKAIDVITEWIDETVL